MNKNRINQRIHNTKNKRPLHDVETSNELLIQPETLQELPLSTNYRSTTFNENDEQQIISNHKTKKVK